MGVRVLHSKEEHDAMIFTETTLPGAYLIDMQPLEDARGFFARAWCQREFEARGLAARMVQANISFNHHKGTLRGMHYQLAPYSEVKIIRCIRGAIYDVIIDLRPDSPTYLQWLGVELTPDTHRMLYVPENFAHGFQTTADATEVSYQVSQFYTPAAEQGLCWNDPAVGIKWPLAVSVMSEKDQSWAPFVASRQEQQRPQAHNYRSRGI
jgi:dTDP-4-dehydrorhamnose 3,5-epimerase